MSVDFLTCKHCEENFCDCGDYVSCNCGENWCSDECAEADGFIKAHCKLGKEQDNGYPYEECEFATDGRCDKYNHECQHWVEDTCKYCREEDFDDNILLIKAMELLKCNREFLISKVKNK